MTTRALRPYVPAVATIATAAALMGLTHWGRVPLELGVLVLQLGLGLAVVALLAAPAAGGVAALGTAAAVASLVVVHVDDGRADGLAAVTALAVVAALVLQLARKGRTRVTESLADTFVVVVLICSAACLPAAAQAVDGAAVVRTGLLACGAALAVSRVSDALLRRWFASHDVARSWHGLVLALAVGVAVAVPEAGSALATREAMLIGLCCAAAALTADQFTELAGAEVAADRPGSRAGALRPVTVLLPFAVLGPVLLAAARLLERT